MRRRLAARSPVHYGWVIVVWAIAGIALGAGSMFWAVAVYVPRIAEDFGTGRTTIVAAFMLSQSVFAFIGPLTGRYVDQHGARGVLIAGAVLCPLALGATAFSREVWHLYTGMVLVGVARTLVFPMPYNWVITRWFEGRRRQGALGVVTVGFGMGGAVVLPVLAYVANQWGWPVAMLSSAVALAAVQGFAALFIIADRPSDIGQQVNVAPEERRADDAGEIEEWGFTARQALRTPAFWLLALYTALVFPVQAGVSLHQAPHLIERGLEPTVAATIVSAFALSSGVAGFAVGFLPRRVPTGALLAAMLAAGALLMTTIATPLDGFAAAGLFGFGIGGILTLTPVAWADYFGRASFGAIRGVALTVQVLSQAAGPIFSGVLHDLTGDYQASLYAFTGLAGAAALAALLVRRA
jgi:MFS transporter, OFA family, oxalate/formate antiporter